MDSLTLPRIAFLILTLIVIFVVVYIFAIKPFLEKQKQAAVEQEKEAVEQETEENKETTEKLTILEDGNLDGVDLTKGDLQFNIL